MVRLGLDYEIVKNINPASIYAETSVFGHNVLDFKKPAYDILVQVRGGTMGITTWSNTSLTRAEISIGDLGVALFITIAVNKVLYQREKLLLVKKLI